MAVLRDVVIGVIVNTETNSKYKYDFLDNTIEYLLEQTKLLDAEVLKSVIDIFNCIWAVYPILDKNWGKDLIEKTHPNSDYNEYMKSIKTKRVQEYQFFKLYEKIHDYGVEYFNLLKSAMNCDLSISNEIIKGFKYLLNAMHPNIFAPLIKDLLESSDQEYSKFIMGRITNNIASRSPEQSMEMLEFCLDHRLLEKDDETGKDTLVSYKYETNEYYIEIMSSAAYHDKESAKVYINKIITLFKLITEHFEEDKHKNDFRNLIRALISPYMKLNVKYPWVMSIDKWNSLEYQADLWKTLGDLEPAKVDIRIEHITQEDIDISLHILNDHIFPWIRQQIEKGHDKNNIKTISMILSDIHAYFCTLLPSKNHNKLKDFTSYYYDYQGITEESISKLFAVEKEIYDISLILDKMVMADETLK